MSVRFCIFLNAIIFFLARFACSKHVPYIFNTSLKPKTSCWRSRRSVLKKMVDEDSGNSPYQLYLLSYECLESWNLLNAPAGLHSSQRLVVEGLEGPSWRSWWAKILGTAPISCIILSYRSSDSWNILIAIAGLHSSQRLVVEGLEGPSWSQRRSKVNSKHIVLLVQLNTLLIMMMVAAEAAH